MKPDSPRYWFAVKSYGWGWGLPVRWQGWLALVLYFAAIYLGIRYIPPKNHPAGFIALLAIASAAFVTVVFWKGERPLGWRWGK